MITRRSLLFGAASASLPAQEKHEWGSPVIDIHCHMRQTIDANLTHMAGSGITHAILLTGENAYDRARDACEKYPGKFRWSASANLTQPGAEAKLAAALDLGAIALGELKSHVEADGPELKRMYAFAAERNVPVLVHFQEVDHFPGEGKWSSGFKRFEAVLKANPKTKFVGHCDAFWANISVDYAEEAAYPAGPVKPGGITDKLLSDYANLYGDLSANSGNNGLSRTPAFTVDFLRRHQNKLMFGSDCSCSDGHGGGTSQANNPAASRLAGKCVARETLGLLQRSTTPAIFRKLVWANTRKLYGWNAA